MSGVSDWHEFGTTLRAMRDAASLTQEELAERSGVSLDTVRSYEQGKRRPSASSLARLAEVVAPDPDAAGVLYEAAGRTAPDSPTCRLFLRGRSNAETIAHQLAGQRWVSLVSNERHEIVGWNGLANDVSETDLSVMLPHDRDRHLLWMATRQRFLDRLTNWDTVIGSLLAALRGEGVELDRPESQTLPPNIIAMVGRLGRESPGVLDRLYRLWLTRPELPESARNIHKIEWRLGDGTELNFHGVFRDWSLYDGIFAFDWMAADEDTSAWVTERLEANGASAWVPAGSPVGPEDFPELLEAARAESGLSRAGLADRTGIATSTIYAYEHGRFKPTRERLVVLARAMSASGLTTNRLLTSLGYAPEPSLHARWLAGESATSASGGERLLPGNVPREQIHAELDAIPWPCYLVNGHCQIERANRPARALFDVAGLAPDGESPHLLRFVLSPEVRERVVNWPELTSAVLPDTLRLQIPDLPDPKPAGAFRREVERIRVEDASGLRVLLNTWETHPGHAAPLRVAVPLQWRLDDGGVADFHCFLTRWNVRDAYWALDWHPANAVAWEAVREGLANGAGQDH